MTGVEVNAVIDKLADKLAVPAGKLMELIPALGVKELALLLMSVIVLVLCVGVGILIAPRVYLAWVNEDNCFIAVGGVFLSMLLVVFDGLALVGFLSSFSNVALWLYNPQAWALDYILRMIR